MKIKGINIFVGAVILVVLVTVIEGLIMVGTPQNTRLQALDDQRINQLQQLMYAVNTYSDKTGSLPNSLATLVAQPDGAYLSNVTDPETHKPYTYQLTSTSTYAVCATFDLPTPSGDTNGMYSGSSGYTDKTYLPSFWQHGIGLKCFDLTQAINGHPINSPPPIPAGAVR